MNTFVKFLLAAVVVLGCVGAGAFAGCIAGFAVAAGIKGGGTPDDFFVQGALVGMSLGALCGLAGGGMLARKVINPPPPRE